MSDDGVSVPLPPDDEDMEDGEVETTEEQQQLPRRKRIEITIKNNDNNGALPDLLQEIGSGDGSAAGGEPVLATAERLEARAKRFNIQNSSASVYDDIIGLYKSIGIPSSEYEGVVNPDDRLHRLEAVHLRGFDGRGTKSEDIYEYFKDLDFAPVSMEWVDSNSCNVIWALATSSARALLTLSRPIHVPEAALREAEAKAAAAAAVAPKSPKEEGEAMDDDDEEMVLVRKADEYNSDKENDDDDVIGEDDTPSDSDSKARAKILEKFSEPGDQAVTLTDLGGNINHHTDYSEWRLGRPSKTLGNRLFMRIATRTDTKQNRDAKSPRDNRVLRNAGGLLSSSRKRKIQEQMAAVQNAAEEYEVTSKRYSGGLGKNPWGGIAEEWSKSTGGNRDFADELGELASQLRGKRSSGLTRERVTVSSRLGRGGRQVTAPLTDWDAPELNEAALTKPIDVDADHNDADSESENANGEGGGRGSRDEHDDREDGEAASDEDFEDWKKRLKIPKMSMHADEEQAKKSAFARVGGGGGGGGAAKKRKSEDGGPRGDPPASSKAKKRLSDEGLKSVRNTLARKSDLRAKIPGTGLSDKLKSRLGGGLPVSRPRNYSDEEDMEEEAPTKRTFEFHERRINRRRSESCEADEEDTRDPLEKEDDLSREYRESGGQLPNMVIQVTRSPEHEAEDKDGSEPGQEDNAMDQDEEEPEERPRIQSMVSMVKKIKTEKGEEERKAKARREKDRAEKEEKRRREKEAERDRREREERKERERQREKEEKERQAARLARREKERRDRQTRDDKTRRDGSSGRRQPPAVDRPVRIKKEKTSDDERRDRRKRMQQGRGKRADSSDSDSSSGSSSDSDSDSSSSSSDSDSDSSSSSSSSSSGSSSDSSSGSDRGRGRRGGAKQAAAKKKQPDDRRDRSRRGEPEAKKKSSSKTSSSRPGTSSKTGASSGRKQSSSSASKSKSSDAKRSGKSGSSGGGSKDLNDKLQDYLKKAKERQKKDGSGSSSKKK